MTKQLHKQDIIWGYLFALGATAIWSGNFIIARGLNESIPPISLAFYRWCVAIIVILPLALKPLISEWLHLKKNIFYLVVMAFLGVTTFNTLIYYAGQTSSAVNLSLIAIIFPIFIIILSRLFLHELITFRKGLGIVLVAIGIILLISKGDFSSLLNLSFAIGDIWMLSAALIFAVYSFLLKYKPEKLSILAFQLSTFILGIIFLLPFFIYESLTVPVIEFNTITISSIIYLGVFASLTAFILWNKSIALVGPSKAGIIYYTLPLFSGLLAYIFLKESISIIHFYSAVLIVIGILTANYGSVQSTG